MLQALRWSFAHRALRLVGDAGLALNARTRDNGRIDPKNVRRVLVVRVDEIGDVVLMSPFLRELRGNLPHAWITLLVRPAIENLVEFCPYVNEVLTYEPPSSRYWRSLQAMSRALRLARRHLWKRDYDLAIIPRWDVDIHFGAMVTFVSGARQRLGYSEKVSEEKCRLNAGLESLLTHASGAGSSRHEVERNLDLLALFGGTVKEERLELWSGEADERFADRFLRRHRVHKADSLVAIAPGAGHPKRMWPLVNFAEFGAWAGTHCGARLLVVGGREDERLGDEIRRGLGDKVINAAGRTSLRETGSLLKRCDLFVGNDAGPMHLAAAAGVPIVEISCHPLNGSTGHVNSPERFGPWAYRRLSSALRKRKRLARTDAIPVWIIAYGASLSERPRRPRLRSFHRLDRPGDEVHPTAAKACAGDRRGSTWQSGGKYRFHAGTQRDGSNQPPAARAAARTGGN